MRPPSPAIAAGRGYCSHSATISTADAYRVDARSERRGSVQNFIERTAKDAAMNIPEHILWDDEYIEWGPLERVVPYEECGAWMWMHAVDTADGQRVHFYKHICTRRYLQLDEHGNLYSTNPDGLPHLVTSDPKRIRAHVRSASACSTSGCGCASRCGRG